MRLLVSICVTLAFALLAAPARADHGEPVADPTLGRYMEIAKAYWGGQTPTCTEPDGTVIGPHAAMADDPRPNVAAWAQIGGCRIWLDSDYWPAPPSEEYCNLIAHEWGHLTGRGHSDNPQDLMWPQWTNDVVPQCAQFRQAGLGAPSAKAVSSRSRRPHRNARKAHRARRTCMELRKRERRARLRSVRRRFRHRRCPRRAKRRHVHRIADGSLLTTWLSQRPISLDGPLAATHPLSPSGT